MTVTELIDYLHSFPLELQIRFMQYSEGRLMPAQGGKQ